MKHLLSLFLSLAASATVRAQAPLPAYQIAGRDTTCSIFVYSPGVRQGLHLAYLTDDETWHDVGQLCSSDYAQWGSEKRMYTPYVTHANDGSWRLLFSVNDYSPCFAAAYSEDLVTWRPQDYPRMKEKGVLEPIMFQMDDGTFDIYFKTKDGQRHYVQATKDFRHFTESDEPSTITDDAWVRDTATVDGHKQMGNLFDVPKIHLDYICQYFAALDHENQLAREKMGDDPKRFAQIGNHLTTTLTVDPAQSKAISDKLVGVFFEDISYAADGGLYAELVQNRDFEYSSADHRGWNASTAWRSSGKMDIETDIPLSKNNPHYAVMNRDTLYNIGWDGISDRGALYDFSFYARNIDAEKNQIEVALVAPDGTVLAEEKIKTEGQGWNRYTVQLNTESRKRPAQTDKCQLRLVAKKEGRVAVDMVSLFPHDTFKGHGLRKDLAEAIAALHPKFVRFPGGCMSHGQGLGNIYHWNETVGPWQDRTPAPNIWSYHQTRGLGFYEYFQFCEDIGAEPLPVLAAGVPCQNSVADSTGYGGQQGGIPMKDMPAYCEEILNLIEWANGDPATSKWARMRAEAGHPAPFNLKCIGIGNEDLISTVFEERYEMICKAIKQKYPTMKVCGTVGPFHDPSADYIEGWKFTREHGDLLDIVDEHYYETPGWFMHHQDYYDHYDRKGAKVYLGEYASKTRTLESALVEAMHLCSLQRNGDVVEMSSYAPLLCKEGHANWNPDMIYFNNDTITCLTPSYYTQLLFGTHSGDTYVASGFDLPENVAYRVAASVVKDSKTGHAYLTLVNALPASLTVNVKGVSLPQDAQAVGFSGQVGDKTVGLDRLTLSGPAVEMPPYSVRVITLK
jgi:alpha-L-arabinofuranosidase